MSVTFGRGDAHSAYWKSHLPRVLYSVRTIILLHWANELLNLPYKEITKLCIQGKVIYKMHSILNASLQEW